MAVQIYTPGVERVATRARWRSQHGLRRECVVIPAFCQKNNGWRDAYKLFMGMNLGRLMSILDAGERGEHAYIQWCYHFMERSDPTVFAVMQRRGPRLLMISRRAFGFRNFDNYRLRVRVMCA
jgi:hypothetical protein